MTELEIYGINERICQVCNKWKMCKVYSFSYAGCLEADICDDCYNKYILKVGEREKE